MFKSALFWRKKTTATGGKRNFGDFYNEWLGYLSMVLLPSLSSSPALMSTQVEALHQHFILYYEALDEAAAADVAQCLYPEWRNSLEKPFLWLGDFHPYLFTNILRSFIEDENDGDGDGDSDIDNNQDSSQEYRRKLIKEDGDLALKTQKKFLEGSWRLEKVWKSPSRALMKRMDQIECGLRLMVPALMTRARELQWKLARRVATQWGDKEMTKKATEEGVAAELEELVGVVVDANRIRRSVLADILSVTNLYQEASFLEALARFMIGFRDEKLLREFQMCDKKIN